MSYQPHRAARRHVRIASPKKHLRADRNVVGVIKRIDWTDPLRTPGFAFAIMIQSDMNCSVDLRSTTAVRDRRYSRMRNHIGRSV